MYQKGAKVKHKRWLVRCIVPGCKRYCVDLGLVRTSWKDAGPTRMKVLKLMYRLVMWEKCPLEHPENPYKELWVE